MRIGNCITSVDEVGLTLLEKITFNDVFYNVTIYSLGVYLVPNSHKEKGLAWRVPGSDSSLNGFKWISMDLVLLCWDVFVLFQYPMNITRMSPSFVTAVLGKH